MSIKYKFKKIKDNLNKEDKTTGYYPQVVNRGTISTDEMLYQLSGGSMFKEAEMRKSLSLIQDFILQSLKNGHNVCLTGFGTFSVSAECEPVQGTREIRAESIKVKGMKFRTSPSLNNKLRAARFEKD